MTFISTSMNMSHTDIRILDSYMPMSIWHSLVEELARESEGARQDLSHFAHVHAPDPVHMTLG